MTITSGSSSTVECEPGWVFLISSMNQRGYIRVNIHGIARRQDGINLILCLAVLCLPLDAVIIHGWRRPADDSAAGRAAQIIEMQQGITLRTLWKARRSIRSPPSKVGWIVSAGSVTSGADELDCTTPDVVGTAAAIAETDDDAVVKTVIKLHFPDEVPLRGLANIVVFLHVSNDQW